MAGGNWSAQNKVRPGVYINFKSEGAPPVNQGVRGTVAIAKALSWGEPGKAVEIAAGADVTPYVGVPLTDPGALFLREMFKGTNVTGGPVKVLLVRLEAAGAVKAAGTIGTGETAVTVTARYPGVRGNDLSVAVTPDVDEAGRFTVSTLVGGQIVDMQQVRTAAELAANGWVTFSQTGTLTAAAGVTLTGGADGTVEPSAYAAALEVLEPCSFDILAYDGTDKTVQAAMIAFVRRLARQEGRYAQLVTAGAQSAGSPFVISTNSGVVLEDGTQLTANQVVWWLAGAQAGAQYADSLTYAAYPGAADVEPRLTNDRIEEEILSGNLVLVREFDRVRIETDINTLTTYTPDTGQVFHKNLTMRVCGSLANDIYREFSLNYLGKVKNNSQGRGLFQAAVLGYLRTMYERGALRERPTGADVTVEPGAAADSIVVTAALQIGDAVEKVYLTVAVS